MDIKIKVLILIYIAACGLWYVRYLFSRCRVWLAMHVKGTFKEVRGGGLYCFPVL